MACSMRRSDHPSRPSASTCCSLLSLTTLLLAAKEHAIPAGVNVSAATGGRFSGVDQWPVLGVHRGQAATALQNARLYAQLDAKANEIDRLRQFSEDVVESL